MIPHPFRETAKSAKTAYRTAFGVAIVAVLFLVWLSLGVGIIGRDGDPANVMYFGVVAVGLVGGLIARFRAGGMARVLLTMTVVQACILLIALVGRLGLPWSGPLELILLNGFFIAAFGASAWLFRRVAVGRRGGSVV